MTPLVEMDPEKWAVVGWIAHGLVALWCGAWLWWTLRKPVDRSEQYERFD